MAEVRIESDGVVKTLYIDGQQVDASRLTLHVDARSMPTLTVEYPCYERLTFDGEATVEHFCPHAKEDNL